MSFVLELSEMDRPIVHIVRHFDVPVEACDYLRRNIKAEKQWTAHISIPMYDNGERSKEWIGLTN